MLTDVGFSVRVPVLSLLFSDSLIAVTVSTTSEPAGITTRPALSLMSLSTVAVTVSPTLFLLERISEVVLADKAVPAFRPVLAGGAGVEAEAGALALGDDGLEVGAGWTGLAGVRGAGAEALAVGWSFNSAVVSTGASCR